MELTEKRVWIENGKPAKNAVPDKAGKTISERIISSHDSSANAARCELRFDSLISHDITYVGIIQTARASGLEHFPVPYVMTNCHNSLCAVGGTINEDDHAFGLSAAKKYGGIYVPANLAVIHQYAREMMSGAGRMILGSDSHTRYGALGTMGIGEGGPEIVRQLLGNTYAVAKPEVVLVWLSGAPAHGVGPHDVAIALCGAVYKNGFAKNKVLEFAGPGLKNLAMDFRIGIDVMTTETACLSSIWETDSVVEEYYAAHGRAEDYKKLSIEDGAQYDGMIDLNLSEIEPMAALPFHPSNAFTLRELIANGGDILRDCELNTGLKLMDKLENGRLRLDQGVIAGCAGGMYDNIAEAAAIMSDSNTGSGYFSLSVYPPSLPVNMELMRSGVQQSLMAAGAVFKPCFCGPCFGAGDVPSNGGLSARHTTRNFPNREGSRPADGQIASVVLMDARSIAATAKNGGLLSSAAEIDYTVPTRGAYSFDRSSYDARVWFGFNKPEPETELRFGPNITAWPEQPELPEHLVLRLASVIHDPVTTTDELIPSGETSSYRSNPLKLAEFTLSRRDPEYVSRAKAIQETETARENGEADDGLTAAMTAAGLTLDVLKETRLGSAIYANCPGDGSAREQAASCQRVLGGAANICKSFATKRYRSNCVNWGMLPLIFPEDEDFTLETGDYIVLPNVRAAIANGADAVDAVLVSKNVTKKMRLGIPDMGAEERELLLAGCLMNWYRRRNNG